LDNNFELVMCWHCNQLIEPKEFGSQGIHEITAITPYFFGITIGRTRKYHPECANKILGQEK